MKSNDHVSNANERADTLADHLEHIQWAVRLDTIPSEAQAIFDHSSMDIENFKDTDLQKILKMIKLRKNSTDDCIPPESCRIY